MFRVLAEKCDRLFEITDLSIRNYRRSARGIILLYLLYVYFVDMKSLILIT